METLLIVGCGDIARRALPELARRYRVCALVRSLDAALARLGVEQIVGDLDIAATLAGLAGRAVRVLHLAPPARAGTIDSRTRNLLAALSSKSGVMLPRRFVYLSTSGVYGDCAGERVDETRSPRPQTERARRRLDAEQAVAEWGEHEDVQVVILREIGRAHV